MTALGRAMTAAAIVLLLMAIGLTPAIAQVPHADEPHVLGVYKGSPSDDVKPAELVLVFDPGWQTFDECVRGSQGVIVWPRDDRTPVGLCARLIELPIPPAP